MTKSVNKLFVGDNLDVMRGLNSGSVDLIYLDPPFNSKRIYSAPIGIGKADAKGKRKKVEAKFNDIWTWNEDVDVRLLAYADDHPDLFAYIQLAGRFHSAAMKAYLTFMAQRMLEMHRVLNEHGSFYLHCDPTADSYLRLLADSIFGKHNFRNEIIWAYPASPSAAKKDFPRKHDVIFRYSKSADYVFNADTVRVPYSDSSMERIQYAANKSTVMQGTEIKLHHAGKIPPTVWSDIQQTYRYRSEATGYPTQKPLALLDRIIQASSNKGDLVMDPFCGCATTCVAAQNLGRNWIGIDVSEVAVNLVTDRLSYTDDVQNLFTDFDAIQTLPVRTDLKKFDWSKAKVRKHFFKTQEGKCNGCDVQFPDPRHFHIDHIYPKIKGGPWAQENLQLLCGSCNSIKGDRPMEYLNAVLKKRNAKIQMY